MNFNFSSGPEYSLNSSLADELISLYGIQVTFVKTEKLTEDALVFGDFSAFKTEGTFDLYVLPENTESWDPSGYQLTAFGPINFENIVVFAHKDSVPLELNKITGNLLKFPNNKIMEITDTEINVPGVNNLFVFNDAKTILKLSCRPWAKRRGEEIDSEVIPPTSEDFESLDKYFDELIQNGDDLRDAVEVVPSTDTVVKTPETKGPDVIVKKPVVQNEDDIWGIFK